MKYNFTLSKFQDDKVHQEILNFNLPQKKTEQPKRFEQ